MLGAGVGLFEGLFGGSGLDSNSGSQVWTALSPAPLGLSCGQSGLELGVVWAGHFCTFTWVISQSEHSCSVINWTVFIKGWFLQAVGHTTAHPLRILQILQILYTAHPLYMDLRVLQTTRLLNVSSKVFKVFPPFFPISKSLKFTNLQQIIEYIQKIWCITFIQCNLNYSL